MKHKPISDVMQGQGGDLALQWRKARATARSRNQELQALKDRLRLQEHAMASSSEGITISDMRLPDQPLVYVNDGFEDLTGYPRAEVLNRNCRFLQGGETEGKVVEAIALALQEGREYTTELLNYRKDGTPFWNRLSLTPLRDTNGTVTHYVGVQSDITARVEAEQKLRHAMDLLEQTNAELQQANQNMQRNLDAAARVQGAVLPKRLPGREGVAFAWRFRPCEQLAGDILNICELDDAHVALYILDVTGHGTAAALLAVAVSQMLSPQSHGASLLWEASPEGSPERVASPARVAEALNRHFPWDAETGQFFTLLYGVLNTDSGEFRYVSAGHPSPLHLCGSGCAPLPKGTGLPVGLSSAPYEEQRILLQPGHRLVLYSDGITEGANAGSELYGCDRLAENLAKQAGAPLDESLNRVFETFDAWRGDSSPLCDDISLVAVEFGPTAAS